MRVEKSLSSATAAAIESYDYAQQTSHTRSLDMLKHEFLRKLGHPPTAYEKSPKNFDNIKTIATGELFTLLKKFGCLSEDSGKFYAAQVVLALEYLHHCGVVHRDIKPENILIGTTGYILLADFGFSKIIKTRTWTICGTPEYLAPEIITSKGYSFAVDWWSLGVLIFEMCTGYPPFYSADPITLYEKVLTGHFKIPANMSSSCKYLVKHLLEVDPTKRMGALKAGVFDIKSDFWFVDINWNMILHQKVAPPFVPKNGEGETSNFRDLPEQLIKVFQALEYPAEMAKQEYHRERLLTERWNLIRFVSEQNNGTEKLLSDHLAVYERVLEEASSSGLALEVENNFPPVEEKWSILQAVFFSSTVLTTIGYGNIVPETFWGRLFCIAYALIGIPLTLTVIADLGRVFATLVSIIAKQLPAMPKCCSRVSEANPAGQRSLYAFGAVGFLFLYLSAGAGLFKMWEDDWTFYDGFYFCFITMTTIGFGDIVPKRPKYMLICTVYILIGLALTSTIIELVRRQYARSWQQLRALSGPLADTLRRLGDAGRGVDVSALHSDLRKVLTVVTMPRLSSAGGNALTDKRRLEWEAAVEAVIRDITAPAPTQKPPIVQIVIYESSV
uniref:Protein kinase domain-containing protein n=1 Tax=Heliothis virescens TaxID=7102 RepID=A0A2A4J5D2_HELVI